MANRALVWIFGVAIVLYTSIVDVDSQTRIRPLRVLRLKPTLRQRPTTSKRLTVSRAVRIAYLDAKRDVLEQKRLDRVALERGYDRRSENTNMRSSCRFHMRIVGYNRDKAKLDNMGDAGHVVTRATMKIAELTGWSMKQIKANKLLAREWRRVINRECPIKYPKCNPKARYRTPDGSCNNLRNPSIGAALTPQRRIMKSQHHDGFNSPKMVGVNGKPLPSPRLISNLIHKATRRYFDDFRTMIVFHFGQLVEHDVILTPTFRGHLDSDMECCDVDPRFTVKRAACNPIRIPDKDTRFNISCMHFVRVMPTVRPYCPMDVRTPINIQTSYFDCSMVYGSSLEEQWKIRLGRRGYLKITRSGLPTESKEDICLKEHPGDYCFLVGDPRVTLVPGLAVLHILFLREHNRIARILGRLNRHWNDETIFQETKRIITATVQHMTFNKWLPSILPPSYMKKFGLRSRSTGYSDMYNPKVNPSAIVSATTAAMRFAHSNILNHQAQVDRNFKRPQNIPTFELFDRPRFILGNRGRASHNYARWLTSHPMAKSDNVVATAVRQFLFLDDDFHSFDLCALNIQRGRDNAIPSYNQWRKFCGLRPASHFGKGKGGLVDFLPETIKAFKAIYNHVDDIDLFPGGLAERPLHGGILGPTFSCIIALQHRNLKIGDRFWYERPDKKFRFTLRQLNEIKRYSLSKMMCYNFDFPRIQPDIFKLPDKRRNRRIHCNRLRGLNLNLWKERPVLRSSFLQKKLHRRKT